MNRLNWILLATVVGLIISNRRSCNQVDDQQQIIHALADTVKYNADSTKAWIADFQVSQAKDFTKIKGLEGTVLQLQELVKKTNAYNAAVLKNISRIKGVSQTTVLPGDTIYHDSILYLYPTYFTDWKEKWSEGEITAKKDTIAYSFKVYNEFELSQSWKREKWFKKRVGEATVKNLNPYTITTEIRTFNLQTKPNRINLGPSINMNYSFSSGHLTISPGISLQYSLIGW